jgi:hypothetical protein
MFNPPRALIRRYRNRPSFRDRGALNEGSAAHMGDVLDHWKEKPRAEEKIRRAMLST